MSTTPLTEPLPEFDLDPAGLVRPRHGGGRHHPVLIGHVYRFTEIAQAHAALESSQPAGKLVVLT
jgi:hypothetical protein